MGLLVLNHVESSQIKDRTQAPCIGRQILIHWATKEVQGYFILFCFLFSLKKSLDKLRDGGHFHRPEDLKKSACFRCLLASF